MDGVRNRFECFGSALSFLRPQLFCGEKMKKEI